MKRNAEKSYAKKAEKYRANNMILKFIGRKTMSNCVRIDLKYIFLKLIKIYLCFNRK